MTLSKNVGTIDRIARLAIGIALLAAFAVGLVAAPWGYLALGFGAIMLATGALGFCPIYALVGLSTCPLRK